MKKIGTEDKSVKIQLLVLIISIGGVVLATFISVFAVLRLKKSHQTANDEHKNSRKVSLAIPSKTFEVELHQSLFQDWGSGVEEESFQDNKSSAYLEVYNHGNIPAENVMVEIAVDFDELNDFMKNHTAFNDEDNHSFYLSEEEEKVVISFNKVENIKHEISFHLEELGTIHPVGAEKHGIKIHLPSWYIYLLNIKAFDEKLDLFSLHIILVYKDLNNESKLSTKEFLIEPEIHMAKREEEHSNNKVKYRIKGELIIE
ncbi:hypothetical protein EJ573_19915 [Paenibacillus polymyxa]|nr:hypothetical protein FGY93_01020 [Paenibacillus polymyxa]RTZ32097.1 hypothetical protein EJ573_19915 [Paenibacillus polymyxa]